MKSSKRIISSILAFAMGFSLFALPAAADYISSETFGSWVSRNSPEFIQQWTHGFFGAGCTVSEDGRHHASSYQSDLGTGYYDCICSECGHAFRAYYQDSYDDSVSELPAGMITSDGGFVLKMPLYAFSLDPQNFTNYSSAIFDPISGHLQVDYRSPTNNDINNNLFYQFACPVSGYYSCLGIGEFRCSSNRGTLKQLGLTYHPHSGYSRSDFGKLLWVADSSSPRSFTSIVDGSYHSAGDVIQLWHYSSIYLSGDSYRANDRVDIFVPLYLDVLVVPYSSVDVTSGDTYNIDNRVGSLVGNYTYEGDNGTQVIAEDIQIVNETDQSVYNPVTNETYYYNEYTYNYGDRSYDFSFGDRDDHVSVTYGDDCVTIEDGDHTYTIYYTTAINHEHSYTITRVIDPTCTEQGKIYKACSECGDELIEFTDALGHDWQITEQTAVDYVLPEARCPACESQYFTYELADEVFYCICQDCGEEWNCNADVTEGHTTYTCSRCGEERTETNQEQDLSLFEAIGDLLADTFEWITDKLGQFINSLSGLSESFSSRIESLIESVGNYPLLFGAFLAGMPDDLMNIVWFGVIALVFVLVWKKFFS